MTLKQVQHSSYRRGACYALSSACGLTAVLDLDLSLSKTEKDVSVVEFLERTGESGNHRRSRHTDSSIGPERRTGVSS